MLTTVPGRAVDFTPDGKTLMTANRSGTVQPWDPANPAQPAPTHSLTGDDVRCGPDGILAASAGDAIELWAL